MHLIKGTVVEDCVRKHRWHTSTTVSRCAVRREGFQRYRLVELGTCTTAPAQDHAALVPTAQLVALLAARLG
jgi:hypothetical protein